MGIGFYAESGSFVLDAADRTSFRRRFRAAVNGGKSRMLNFNRDMKFCGGIIFPHRYILQ